MLVDFFFQVHVTILVKTHHVFCNYIQLLLRLTISFLERNGMLEFCEEAWLTTSGGTQGSLSVNSSVGSQEELDI